MRPGPKTSWLRWINSLIANLTVNPRLTLGVTFAPEKITPQWLWEHVSVNYWIALVGVLVSLVIGSFVSGVKAGQIAWVAQMVGEKSTPADMTGKPKGKP
jgi:hypothetical protein